MKTTPTLAVVGALMAASCHGAPQTNSQPPHPTAETGIQAQDACIDTPERYIEAFRGCQTAPCVSPNLYGVIASRTEPGPPTHSYPASYQWAWVAGYENLELYARWQNLNCDEGVVTRKILTYVGFGKDYISPSNDYYLSVMDLDDEPSLFVPSFEGWFLAFERQYELQIPLPVQKAVTLANKPGANPIDPIERFVYLTGCDPTAARNCSDSTGKPGEGCNDAYAKIAPILNAATTTEDCVDKFKDHAGADPQAAEVRALLNYCVDANPCNTGLGLSFNPAYQKGGSVLDHYTGREFVLDNKPLLEVQAKTVKLAGVK